MSVQCEWRLHNCFHICLKIGQKYCKANSSESVRFVHLTMRNPLQLKIIFDPPSRRDRNKTRRGYRYLQTLDWMLPTPLWANTGNRNYFMMEWWCMITHDEYELNPHLLCPAGGPGWTPLLSRSEKAVPCLMLPTHSGRGEPDCKCVGVKHGGGRP